MQEKARNSMALRRAQAAANRTFTAADVQQMTEKSLNLAAQQVQQQSEDLVANAKEVARQAAKERKLLMDGQKDRRLSLKIVSEAEAVLAKLEGQNTGMAVGVGKGAMAAAVLLESVHDALSAQINCVENSAKEATAIAEEVDQATTEVKEALSTQKANLEWARDRRASRVAQFEEEKRAREADVEAAASYLQDVDTNCAGLDDNSRFRQQRIATQVHALEDAQKELETGSTRPTPLQHAAGELSDVLHDGKPQTAMEKAAAEMANVMTDDP